MKRIYCANITPCVNSCGEYEMGEINRCEHGETWQGDIVGYILNSLEMREEWTLSIKESLYNVRQHFDGYNPETIVVLYDRNRGPIAVYFVSEIDPELQGCIDFVSSLFFSCGEGRYPMTVIDAEYSLQEMEKDGVIVPSGMTAELFAEEWNKSILD